MVERRTDELTAVNIEYAIFLAETRGLVAGLKFSQSMKLPSAVLDRILASREVRKDGERRRKQRPDQSARGIW